MISTIFNAAKGVKEIFFPPTTWQDVAQETAQQGIRTAERVANAGMAQFNQTAQNGIGAVGEVAAHGIDQGARVANRLIDRGHHLGQQLVETTAHEARAYGQFTRRIGSVFHDSVSGWVDVGAGALIMAGQSMMCDQSNPSGQCNVASSMGYFFFATGGALILATRGRQIYNRARGIEQDAGRPQAADQLRRPLGVHAPAIGPELPEDCTALMRAAYSGTRQELEALQKQGIFLDAKDAKGKTALHWAAIGKNADAIEWLWYQGCNLNELDDEDLSPIHYIERGTPLHELVSTLKKMHNRFKLEDPIYLFYPPENLVFKGGGPKGIAYVGVLKYLEAKKLLQNLQRVSGTSAGAITATLVALGYNGNAMERILRDTDLTSLLDHPFATEQEMLTAIGTVVAKGGDTTIHEAFAAIGNVMEWWNSKNELNLYERFQQINLQGGLCLGDKFLGWIEELIQAKTGKQNCTFGEFKALMSEKGFKHLYVNATRITPTWDIECIDSESGEWDDVIIADAVRASMSIPLLFKPHVLRTKSKFGVIKEAPELGGFIDGGLLRNLPISTFDSQKFRSTNPQSDDPVTNRQTLAFNLVDPAGADPEQEMPIGLKPPTMAQVGLATVGIFAAGEDLAMKKAKHHQQRIVNIDNQGVGLITGFFASNQQKRDLIQSGFDCTQSFFEKQEELARAHEDHNPFLHLQIFKKPEVRVLPDMIAQAPAVNEDELKEAAEDLIPLAVAEAVPVEEPRDPAAAVPVPNEAQAEAIPLERMTTRQLLQQALQKREKAKLILANMDNRQIN